MNHPNWMENLSLNPKPCKGNFGAKVLSPAMPVQIEAGLRQINLANINEGQLRSEVSLKIWSKRGQPFWQPFPQSKF